MLTNCHFGISQLLKKFKTNFENAILNHQVQFDFIEWLLLIIMDIYNCPTIIEPLYEYNNSKPSNTNIRLTTESKHDLISSINENNHKLNINCFGEENKENETIVRLWCPQERWIKVDIKFV